MDIINELGKMERQDYHDMFKTSQKSARWTKEISFRFEPATTCASLPPALTSPKNKAGVESTIPISGKHTLKQDETFTECIIYKILYKLFTN
jgi:hypothetical protein